MVSKDKVEELGWDALTKFLIKRCVAIFVHPKQHKKPIPYGSGTLIKLNGKHYVCTAGHVIKEFGPSKIYVQGVDVDKEMPYLDNALIAKNIEFKEQNIIYAKDQKPYLPLPAFKADTPEGEVVSCWELSFIERIRILFTGKMWVSLMSFNKPLTPSFFSTKKSDVLVTT